jgi:coenzyme F420-0:L-glutamate ligase/coenzyme F420-1:gamma-L-glutamate ligase
MIQVFPIKGIPFIQRGDDLGKILADVFEFKDGDILAVCSTVVSKAEGRVIDLSSISPSHKAVEIARIVKKDPRFVQAVLNESEEILLKKPFLLTKVKSGNICVNAGIDGSNVDKGKVILLPEDPDASAAGIRDRIHLHTGKTVSVIITDTNGRAFRKGVVGVAIGCAGIKPLKDWRGERDIFGNPLEVTIEAVIDELAGFANMIMGEGGWGIPAVVVRGLEVNRAEKSIQEIYRDDKEDVIARALREVRDV